ncbi:MAG: hypothetical protein RQ875_07680 [Vicingaceae bacterium]|nr:hypothetical protein [Vicingaceae bacterium]
MQISFTDKDTQNKIQQDEFLKLSPTERVIRFFILSEQMLFFPIKNKKNSSSNNFEIVIDKRDK